VAQGAYLWDENGKRYIDYHARSRRSFSDIAIRRGERVVEAVRQNDLYG